MKTNAFLLIAVLVSLPLPRAFAQEAPPAAAPAAPTAPAPYEGAVPGGGYVPKIPAGKSPPTITWSGFQPMPDGSSRVFLQITKDVTHAESQNGMNYVVRIHGAHINFFNSRRPLDTRYFSTPVNTVSLKKAGKDVLVTLAMRTASTPSVSTTTDAHGYSYLIFEFPKGDYGVVAPPVPAASAAPKKANDGLTTPKAFEEEDEKPPSF